MTPAVKMALVRHAVQLLGSLALGYGLFAPEILGQLQEALIGLGSTLILGSVGASVVDKRGRVEIVAETGEPR